MFLSKMLKPEDYKSYLGMGQVYLAVGVIGMFIGVSRLLDLVIRAESWLDFTKGLFVGLSSGVLALALVLSIKGMIYLNRHENS